MTPVPKPWVPVNLVQAFIDQEFTSDVNKLRDGLGQYKVGGGTALYDAVVASADELAADAKRPKH